VLVSIHRDFKILLSKRIIIGDTKYHIILV
jgi:hypothetical protein